MATKKKAVRKKTRTKPLRKKALTKAAGKKSAKKKTVKKKTAKKRAAKSSARKPKRTAASRSRKPVRRAAAPRKPLLVEPGPPSGPIPPVEEPIPTEKAVGVVTHYYSHLGVAIVQINTGLLRAGDNIRIKGHTTDLTEQIASMEYEHQHVDEARPGQSVGIKVLDHVREHDIVYVVK
jgi:hypothetical protein